MRRERAMGINAVTGLVDFAPERIVRVWIKAEGARLEALARRLEEAGVVVESASDRALDRLSDGVRHQGVVAEFRPREPIEDKALVELLDQSVEPPLLLVLDGVQDPHNLGACLRSAGAAGATAVVIPRHRAVGLTPAGRRAAAGAAEKVPLAVVANLARTLALLGEHGIWRVGFDSQGEKCLFGAHLEGPLALVMGSEDRGLRRLTRERCDELVHIPMPGPLDSLNVSVAAGIGLFEAVRTRLSR
ncbi:MAG: 23S rRNA (guanosine(2251)-2'-O)-methyltransferase RlmB [Wenzhouxiangella sp.]|nr:23S rRNA (guanosine(2251)-2'-O)-methyltransferase RlmB [Wenzhouxiangella sp.]